MHKLEDKIDNISNHIAEINVTLAKQSIVLEEHVKRTNLLEKKLEPIEKHVHMVHGILKFLGIVAVFLTVYEGLMRMIGR